MEAYSVFTEELKYRVVEKKTVSGKSIFFLQRCNYGYHHYKSKFLFWSEKEPYTSELVWVYVLKNEKAGDYTYVRTHNNGTKKEIDMEGYIERSCKSIDEAKILMEEHKAYINKIQKEKDDTVFDTDKEDKIIPLNYEENTNTVNCSFMANMFWFIS